MADEEILSTPAAEDQDVEATIEEVEPHDPVASAVEELKAREKLLADRLAQQGRESAETRRRLESQVATLQSQLAGINSSLTQQEQQRMEAYLRSLPPEQRQAAEIKQLQRRLDAATRPVTQPRQPAESPGEYTMRRAREIVAEANVFFGLDPNEGLTGREPELDLSTFDGQEVDFIREARKLARKRALGQSEDSVAKSKSTPKTPANDGDVASIVAREVAKALGVSGPNASRPSGTRPGAVTSDTFQSHLNSYDSSRGPKGTIAKLRADVAKAEGQIK